MPPLDRDADRLADAEIDDRLRRAEPLVGGGVGGDDPLPLLEDVVDDRPRDRHPLVGLGRARASGRPWGRALPDSSLSRIAPRSAPIDSKTSSRIWGRERVDVEDVADRLGRPVHDREVHQPVLEPAAGDVGRLEDARALADGNAPEDRRAVVGAGLAEHVDPRRQVAVGPVALAFVERA